LTDKAAHKTRAADDLVAQFEQQILDGVLKAGAALPPEREIVEGRGVSRTVVREALRILASKGLIITQPGYRPIVAEPGYDAAAGAVESVVTQLLVQPGGVRNLFDFRIRMEASLVRDAALKATSGDIARLEMALADNFAAIPNSAAFYATDTAFHAILYDIPQNPVLPAIHKAYTQWLSGHWSKMPRLPSRNQLNYDAHKAIFDEILRRDPDKAEAALREHMNFAWQQVSTTFEGL
jgi:DNA-binding FadR family transcriptional regulator